MKMPINWKTTLSGVSILVTLAAKIINGGTIEATDIASAIGAVGLIAARDHNNSSTS